MRVGVVVSINIHYLYPVVPGAVQVESIVGIGGWSSQDLEMVKVAANSKCFSTISDLHEFLVNVPLFANS
jgi:hypothetical protein